MLRTTTTQAPAAGDDMMVAGEHTAAGAITSRTVTMNSTTATDYGSAVADGSSITPALAVCCSGTLTFGTVATTNYILRLSGNLANFRDGTINVGTTGTPIPRDSTAVLEFDCVADADFGWHNHGGVCNIQGLSRTSGKNVFTCKLNTDEAVAQTVLGVDTDTGWLSGDQIAIASTVRSATLESEVRTLSANANASDMTVTAGLTNAHSGTAPTQAEVINITRNVKVRSVSSTAMTFFHSNATATVDIDWAEFFYMGKDTIADWRGVSVGTTTGSFNMQFSSIHDTEDWGFYVTGSDANNITFSNNVMWNTATNTGSAGRVGKTTGANIILDRNVIIRVVNASFGIGWELLDVGLVYTNNTVTDTNYGAFYSERGGVIGTFSNNTYHSCLAVGARFFADATTDGGVTGLITNLIAWRNFVTGVGVFYVDGVLIDGLTLFGNTTNVLIESSTRHSLGVITMKNGEFNGDTTFATPKGLDVNNPDVTGVLMLDSCLFSVASGIKVAHSSWDLGLPDRSGLEILLRNCKLDAATEIGSPGFGFTTTGYIAFEKYEQTAGSHKTLRRYGTLSTDTTIFNTASPSMRVEPLSATNKLESASLFQGLKVAVNNGSTLTINVFTRKSTAGDGAAYNGAQPRLIVKANPALGSSFNSDTVLDTHTVAAGTWEQLSGTTATVTDDGICEFVIDIDGTAGWVNVDDWSKS
jgi:hypothetical protein